MAVYVGTVTLLTSRGLAQLDSIGWDATVSESHDISNDITDHPVEDGGNVSDHIRGKPFYLTIEAAVSDKPIDPGTIEPGRALAVYERLKALAKGQVFTVATGVGDYDSMAIESLSLPRSSTTGKALRLMLKLKQIRIVRTKVVQLRATSVPRAKGKVKTGKQVPKLVTQAEWLKLAQSQSPSVFEQPSVVRQNFAPAYAGAFGEGDI